jgi:hypothetical protein
VIRNAVLHLFNEQPLVADLYRLPQADDVGLVCTNLRLLNGNRPVFIDDIRSTFFFPYGQIRFVEIPAAAMAASGDGSLPDVLPAGAPATAGAVAGGEMAGVDGAAELAAREAGGAGAGASGGVTAGAPDRLEPDAATGPGTEPEPDTELELDEEFLRRIREV